MTTYLYLVEARARLLGDPVAGSLPLSDSWQVVATTELVERVGWHPIPDMYIGIGERGISIEPYRDGLVTYAVGGSMWHIDLSSAWVRRLLPLMAAPLLSEATDE